MGQEIWWAQRVAQIPSSLGFNICFPSIPEYLTMEGSDVNGHQGTQQDETPGANGDVADPHPKTPTPTAQTPAQYTNNAEKEREKKEKKEKKVKEDKQKLLVKEKVCTLAMCPSVSFWTTSWCLFVVYFFALVNASTCWHAPIFCVEIYLGYTCISHLVTKSYMCKQIYGLIFAQCGSVQTWWNYILGPIHKLYEFTVIKL